MKTLVLLYLLYLELGGVGQGKVTILALSRYMRLSKSGMKDMLEKVSELGLINVYEEFGGGDYKRYKVSINNAGQAHLDNNWEAAQAQYQVHVAETLALINERNSGKYSTDKKLSKKAQAAILAGQRELF
jgi:DNA-binding PadR family transcriptional regulator